MNRFMYTAFAGITSADSKIIQKACKKSQSFDTGLFPASGSVSRYSFNPNSEVAGGVHWNFDHNGSAANMEELTASKSFLKWHGFSRMLEYDPRI
jgi:hypothetical protein